MEKFKNSKLSFKIVFIITAALMLILLPLSTIIIGQVNYQINNDIHDIFKSKAELNASKVQAVMGDSFTMLEDLKNYLENYMGDYTHVHRTTAGMLDIETENSSVYNVPIAKQNVELETYILSTAWSALKNNLSIAGFGVFFEPYAFDPLNKVYGIEAYDENAKNRTVIPVTDYNNYAQKEYYSVPKETKEMYITSPAMQDDGSIRFFISYPIIQNNGFKGVVGIEFLLSSFEYTDLEDEKYSTLFTSILNEDFNVVYSGEDTTYLNLNVPSYLSSKDKAKWDTLSRKNEFFEIITEDTYGKKHKRYVYPIKVGEKNWWIYISVALRDLYAPIYQIVILASEIALVSIVTLILIAIRTLKRVLEPMNQLLIVANNMAAGNLNIHLDLPYEDEIGQLGRVFIHMSRTLNNIIRDIETILEKMAEGDFTTHNEIKADYVGNFEPIKQSLIQINKKLSQTLSDINHSAKEVTVGAEEIAKSAIELAEGTTEQSEIIHKFIFSTEKISENIDTTIARAKETKLISQEAKLQAKECSIVIE
ncbi:hypothetical protein AN640_03450 [Candidatus Epulonipiscium fishelsonii]|uniref:Uncharacterized protein n=1 Tax=Candidatus Epulonipiscium fishelsonii TaxID=77094 RepID=A0ACC8XJ23_9FIRM|nr:hypothetical protein AN640_03450 [Epulopiscium sp. SCG-D08WGA-EpuloA1]